MADGPRVNRRPVLCSGETDFMRVSTTSTITCPRCHVPVEGDFKYCPECAYRLRPGRPDRTQTPPAASRRGTTLFLLAGAALLAAGIFVGMRVHRDVVVQVQEPDRRHLRVVDIQEHTAHIPSGIAEWAGRSVYEIPAEYDVQERFLEVLGEAPAVFADTTFRDALAAPTLIQNPLPLTRWQRVLSLLYRHSQELVTPLESHVPVVTDDFDMMRYEMSRSQWGEFLESVQSNPSQLSKEEYVRDLWRPSQERLEYARGYWTRWWKAVLDEHALRMALLPESERLPEPARPPWLSETTTALDDDHGVLLLIPPSWLRMSADGTSITWNIEEGTEDLPVTGVSWWDIHMFATWATRFLSIPGLALPNWAEWQRAFHGGHAYRPPDDFDERGEEGYSWPWGNERDIAQCNNLLFRPDGEPPSLRPVRRTYPTGNRGFTIEGVLNMPGNAAEWTDNYRLDTRNGLAKNKLYATSTEEDEEGAFLLENVACGGSYLSLLDACQAGSSEVLDKRDRRGHVGFRLILRKTSGIGR